MKGEAREMIRRARRSLLVGGVPAVLGLLVLLAVVDSAQAQARPGTAEITQVTGRVEILRGGQTQWVPAAVGAKLAERDEIRAFAGASAELRLPDTSTLLLSENSRFVVTKLEFDPQNRARTAFFHLAVGKVRMAIAKAAVALVRARQSNFVISTPSGVAAARGSVPVVAYNPATDTTFLAVIDGEASFTDFKNKQTVIVGAGSFITFDGKTGVISAVTPITNLPPGAQAQLATPANPGTGGSPTLVAVTVIIPSTGEVLTLIIAVPPGVVVVTGPLTPPPPSTLGQNITQKPVSP